MYYAEFMTIQILKRVLEGTDFGSMDARAGIITIKEAKKLAKK